jgi:hypothetical protein
MRIDRMGLKGLLGWMRVVPEGEGCGGGRVFAGWGGGVGMAGQRGYRREERWFGL